jgi:hypothetical protein
MSDIFRDFARDVFGVVEVPETIPLKILGLSPPVPPRAAIVSAFRQRAMEVHPDLQFAYDHPVMQPAADAALGTRPEIRELVWARDVLLEMAPSDVTGNSGIVRSPVLPVTPKVKVCRKCQRELGEHECYAVGARHSPRARWCWRCVHDDDAERAKARRRRRRANRRCARCAALFTPLRSDGRYCSPRCRQVAYRLRVTAKKGSSREPLTPVTADVKTTAKTAVAVTFATATHCHATATAQTVDSSDFAIHCQTTAITACQPDSLGLAAGGSNRAAEYSNTQQSAEHVV